MPATTVETLPESRIDRHKAVLAKKRMIREVFREFHVEMRRLDEQFFGDTPGLRIELGAGAAPIRDTFSDVLSSDIVAGSHLDMVLNAEDMNLDNSSVRAIYGQNCFHHFPHPEKFFGEVERVVRPGGGVILIEPYYGPFASLVYPRLFKIEDFNKRMAGWNAAIRNEEEGANQALSYIVFRRDRQEFGRRFPNLEIVHERPLLNYVRYVMSGGLNFPQLLPDFCIPLLKGLEWIAAPVAPLMALHHFIVVRRKRSMTCGQA